MTPRSEIEGVLADGERDSADSLPKTVAIAQVRLDGCRSEDQANDQIMEDQEASNGSGKLLDSTGEPQRAITW